jgi:hypothetical protein
LSDTKSKADKPLPANKQKGKKICTACHDNKKLTDFYLSYSPMYSLDKRTPVCKECCKNSCLNEDGTVCIDKLKNLLRQIDKPLYYDLIASAEASVKKENSYLSSEEVKLHGYDILSKYFTLIAMRQDIAKSYSDSEKDGFMHQNNNRSIEEKKKIETKYSDTKPLSQNYVQEVSMVEKIEKEPLVYNSKWKGRYTATDIQTLDDYYNGLDRDYKIITANHRDYARKIAKASLQMDKMFDDMMNGIEGADKKYENATKAFDMLSKSAKFSESTRSVNDVGISSFSKVAAMVEAHNWIPTHKPLKKDTIDEMIDYLSTITKSL